MILNVLKQVHDQVAAAVTAQYGLAEVPPFAIEVPPNRALGDLAVTVAFQLAAPLRKAPRAIAQELAGVLGAVPGVTKVEAAPNGYLNLSLDRRALPARAAARRGCRPPRRARRRRPSSSTRRSTRTRRRTSAICGTPRSATRSFACYGSAARRSKCRTTSTISASRSPTSSSASARSSGRRSARSAQIADTTRFDYYCWDLYARVTEWYERRPERLAVRAPGAARSRSRRQRHRRDRRLHRRSHRPRAPEDDGAAEHRLRPADATRATSSGCSSGRARSRS